jgi:hypothetical protein
MNGPTRSPEEEIAYEEGITPRQWVIMLGVAAVFCAAIFMMLQHA